MTPKKLGLGLLGFALIAMAALSYQYWRSTTLTFNCSNETLRESPSPDAKYIAAFFERNCGATTPYYRVVALRPAGTTFNGDRHEDWVFVTRDRADVQLKWKDVHHLELVTNATEDGSGTPKTWRDVDVTNKLPSD